MGDAFDDWLIEKILLLRKGSVIASGVRRIEEVIIGLVCLLGFQMFWTLASHNPDSVSG